MSLKLRLAVVFFLLSAVPLSGIAFYSYVTSREAMRQAAELETELAAREMESRVSAAASGVGKRLEQLRDLSVAAWSTFSSGEESGALHGNLVASLAEAAPYFEDLRFVRSGESETPEAALDKPGSNGLQSHAAPVPPAILPKVPAVPAVGANVAAPSFPPLPRTSVRMFDRVDEATVRRELEKVRAEMAQALSGVARARREAERRAAAPGERAALREAERTTRRELAELSRQLATKTPHAPRASAAPSAGEQILKGEFSCPIQENGRVVGTLTARIRARELLSAVLAETRTDQGEIPFALDADSRLYAASPEHASRLEQMPDLRRHAAESHGNAYALDDWVVVTRRDPGSGLRFGIARPLSDALSSLRRAAARNLGLGIGLVGLALAGIFPLAGRMTRNLESLTDGATRLASGDLAARVPVRSHDELGRLASTFNHMAETLEANQRALLEQERLRKEEEIARRLLAAENERKSLELEEARQFQLSLLPRALPEVEGLELAVSMHTATEVGGDYYDGQMLAGGEVVLAIGDATGHGAASATMVTVVKSLFVCEAGNASPAGFLLRANHQIQRMALGRMAMALTVVRARGRSLALSAAGMPPALWRHAASGEVSEVAIAGLPLGSLPGACYEEVALELAPGDDLLLMSDGFPELQSPSGEPLGYEAARAHFAVAAAHARSAPEMLAELRRAADDWAAGGAPSDDLTFLLIRAV